MAKSEKTKQGCFSNFLHVLLCAGNGTSPHPVHPSDHVTEQDETELLVHSKKDSIFEDNDSITTPGIVARLMGLESLPKSNFFINGGTPDSVTRSRSVNFVDYMVNFDVLGNNGSRHRRVKTSASFREVPAPAPAAHRVKEENDLVVFCWDGDVCNEHEVGFEFRKIGIGFEELKKQRKKQGNKNNNEIISVKKERNNKNNSNGNSNNNDQKKNKKISKLKNEPRRVPCRNYGKKVVRDQSEDKGFSSVSSSRSSSSCSSSKLQNRNREKKEFVKSCNKKRIRKEKLCMKMESDCNSENLSPISVQDIGTNCLDGTNPLASKSKLKSSSIISFSERVEHSAENNNKGFACAYTEDINKEAEYLSELFLKLQTLTEQDIREFTTKHKYDYEEFKEICFSFENNILDLLLHEFVNELL